MKPDYWEQAVRELGKRDAVLRKLARKAPDLMLRSRGDPFSTLARAIVGQQISVKAAQSIWNRVAAAAVKMKPANILALPDQALRDCGLSWPKVSYVKDLAAHFADGRIRPRRWTNEDEETIIAELVEVKGIGRWSAEMFLIFYLCRPDVLPVDDLGLQRAMEKHYNGGAQLNKQAMREIGARWAPWRTVATWYMWRSLEPDPVEY